MWVKENSKEIEASGLPSAIFTDENSWFDFLEYSALLGNETEWNIDELSLRQKAVTLRLIWDMPIYLQAYLQTGVVRKLTFDLIKAAEE